MVQLIMGLKGSGKTKRLVEMVATAVREESGSVVCIEKDKKLTYDIPYQARLIYACDYAYAMGSYDFFKGFLSGLHAGNYDITRVFIDGLYKIIGGKEIGRASCRERAVCMPATTTSPMCSLTTSRKCSLKSLSSRSRSSWPG